MKKIAFFQSDLGYGGIQKSLINLLRNMDYSRFQVDLYLTEPEGECIAFPPELKVRYLKPVSKLCSFMPFDLARRFIHYDFPENAVYDLAVDFNSYQCSCAAAALSVPARRRVMWIHNDVEVKLREEWKYRVLWNSFKGKFKYYDEFVAVSGALIGPFQKMSGMVGKPYRVIRNYIDRGEITEKLREEPADLTLDPNCVNFVALGRLCHQKGYDLMLALFREACAVRDELRLYIIGDGPDRAGLEKLAEALGLRGKVFFLGAKSNPFCYMKKMDAFISTSRYEGQGMNIVEAMAVGLPVYCPKRLEKYMDGFCGYEDEELVQAIAGAVKAEKRPMDLTGYNRRIMEAVAQLAEE